MFTAQFLKDAAERAIKTAAQSILVLWGSSHVVNLFDIDFGQTLGVAGGMALVSVLTSVVSEKINDPNSASMVRGE